MMKTILLWLIYFVFLINFGKISFAQINPEDDEDDNDAQYGYNSRSSSSDNNDEDLFLEDYCYRTDDDPYFFFGTKTSYDILTKRGGQQHIVPGCQPVQFWSINRHGTRLPKMGKIRKLRKLQQFKEEIMKNYEIKKSYPNIGQLCVDDYNILKRWRWNESITEDKAASLTPQGLNELRLLARRYKSKFPQLFNQPYNDQNYYFQYTQTDRTHDSYQAFIEGLFGNEFYQVHANTFGNDMLLKAYRNCPEWHEKNENTNEEYKKFLESEDYLKMAHQIFRRLGFRNDLNTTIIQDIYDMCRFNKAWQLEQPSPWCIAFTKEHLKILEFGEDLKEFYQTGPGNELVKNIGCGPVQDMYKKFEKTVKGNNPDDGNKVTALFTHAATMQAVFATLGIAKDDEPLLADNYRKYRKRMWRTSFIDPFAANLVAVLYQCQHQSNSSPGNNSTYKVMFFINEIPIEEYLGCSVGLCDWEIVQENFEKVAENCNVEAFCEGRNSSEKSEKISYLFVITYLLVVGKLLLW